MAVKGQVGLSQVGFKVYNAQVEINCKHECFFISCQEVDLF